jgi:hypothetical protein
MSLFLPKAGLDHISLILYFPPLLGGQAHATTPAFFC